MILDMALLIVFPALMAFAASSDLFTMTISNRISIALVASFILLALWVGMPLPTIGWHLSCGLAILCITFALFTFGWIGGGDAKLAAATAVWLGWSLVLEYGALSSILGGALTVGIIMLRRAPVPYLLDRYEWLARLSNPKNGVPYGIALAAAGLMIYPSTQLWLAASAM